MNNLKIYNSKRDFKKSNEPKGTKVQTSKKLRFVVQHHLARKDHYDVRLEYNGVLLSWAVPKGPSYKRRDKRLAVMVEDHPISYRNFEGTIPKGEYGGGTVMIFDEGYYKQLNDSKKGLKDGILKFELFGSRLKGIWSLIRFKEENWLMIKENDEYYEYNDISKINTSIKSNRTMEEIENNIKLDKNEYKCGAKISSPDKIIYKKEKITKLDIINYYNLVSKRMLPFLSYRLISTVRCPNGNDGDIFFKKHLEEEKEGLVKIDLNDKKTKDDDYFFITNKKGLISEVQMNSIEFHIWGSKINNLDYPDIMVFDLDPDENLSLKKLRKGVKDLKSILDELKLKSYLKTSGGKGYHIVVPIKNKNFEEVREISKNIATLMENKWPEKYTSNIRKNKRKGKIFIDWVRNTKGATSVAPYSLRIKDKATVSFPIKWSELDKIKPNEITLKKALEKIKEPNPWKNFKK